MNSAKRRCEIMEYLKKQNTPITGSELAEKMGVSRQVIVTDIALLRAKGEEILATPQGYVLVSSIAEMDYKATIVCKHTKDQIREELSTILELGGKIIDVTVEHPLYGELKGMLMINSFKDLEEFITRMEQTDAKPLSALTEGVHLHTIKAPQEDILKEIKHALTVQGFLIKE